LSKGRGERWEMPKKSKPVLDFAEKGGKGGRKAGLMS